MAEIAARHQVSPDAVLTLPAALQAGGGNQAQFSHAELGGLGQWARGGMVMTGDMFNTALKARVDSLCSELSSWLDRTGGPFQGGAQTQRPSPSGAAPGTFAVGARSARWPAEPGTPASAGRQNGFGYAFFPVARRLAIDH